MPELRLSTAQGPAFPLGKAGERWAQLVNEQAGGAFEVEAVSGRGARGAAIPRREFGALRDGAADLAVGSALAWSAQLPAFGVVRAAVARRRSRANRQALAADAALFAASRVRATRAGVVVRRGRAAGRARRSRRPGARAAPADLAGLRLRVPEPLLIETYAALGARPESMDFAEAQAAFAAGTLDGQEAPPSALAATRAAASGQNSSRAGARSPTQMVFAVRRATWDALDRRAARARARGRGRRRARGRALRARGRRAGRAARQGVTIVQLTRGAARGAARRRAAGLGEVDRRDRRGPRRARRKRRSAVRAGAVARGADDPARRHRHATGGEHAGQVLVTGSHGGLIAAAYAAQARVRAAIFNDAGRGRDDAGVAGLAALDRIGIAACAVAHTSARIGDAADAFARGMVSACNAAAAACGVAPGMRCDAAASAAARRAVVAGAPRVSAGIARAARARVRGPAAGLGPRLDRPRRSRRTPAPSSSSVRTARCTAAIRRAALPVARARRSSTTPGAGPDDANVSRLPVLAARGMPAGGRGLPVGADRRRALAVGDRRALGRERGLRGAGGLDARRVPALAGCDAAEGVLLADTKRRAHRRLALLRAARRHDQHRVVVGRADFGVAVAREQRAALAR